MDQELREEELLRCELYFFTGLDTYGHTVGNIELGYEMSISGFPLMTAHDWHFGFGV